MQLVEIYRWFSLNHSLILSYFERLIDVKATTKEKRKLMHLSQVSYLIEAERPRAADHMHN